LEGKKPELRKLCFSVRWLAARGETRRAYMLGDRISGKETRVNKKLHEVSTIAEVKLVGALLKEGQRSRNQ